MPNIVYLIYAVTHMRHLKWSLLNSTAKQTFLGSLLGLKLNLYCVLMSSFWRHLSAIVQLVQSSSTLAIDEQSKSHSQTTT